MPVQLDKLDREAVVMLYLAGEMEAGEREAFERRLAADPDLSAHVQQARAAQSAIAGELQRLDARTRLPASEGVVTRRVSRAIVSWLASRSSAPVAAVRQGFALPWWSYPSAVAASLLIGFLVWSSRQEVGPMEAAPEARHGFSVIEAEQAELAEWLTSSLTADASLDAEMEQLLSAAAGDDLNSVYSLPREEAP